MDRIILHSDCNCFYASVEMLHHPELAGKPLAVGGDPEARHGIVLTANYIAKRMGVKTGMALWQARQACPDLVFVPPRMDLYLRFSRMAREIYLEYTDQVENFGCDEAWLAVERSRSIKGDGMTIAREISDRIKQELGITVSIGVSWNKIFAAGFRLQEAGRHHGDLQGELQRDCLAAAGIGPFICRQEHRKEALPGRDPYDRRAGMRRACTPAVVPG